MSSSGGTSSGGRTSSSGESSSRGGASTTGSAPDLPRPDRNDVPAPLDVLFLDEFERPDGPDLGRNEVPGTVWEIPDEFADLWLLDEGTLAIDRPKDEGGRLHVFAAQSGPILLERIRVRFAAMRSDALCQGVAIAINAGRTYSGNGAGMKIDRCEFFGTGEARLVFGALVIEGGIPMPEEAYTWFFFEIVYEDGWAMLTATRGGFVDEPGAEIIGTSEAAIPEDLAAGNYLQLRQDKHGTPSGLQTRYDHVLVERF